MNEHLGAYFSGGVCVEEQDEACFWKEYKESTDVRGGKAKTERQHDSAIFLLPTLSSLCSSTKMTTTHFC